MVVIPLLPSLLAPCSRNGGKTPPSDGALLPEVSIDSGNNDEGIQASTTCIGNWPKSGRAPQVLAPLAVTAPRILWAQRIGTSRDYGNGVLRTGAGLVEAKGNLLLTTGGPLAVIQKANGAWSLADVTASRDWMSPPVSDEDGNVYSVGRSGFYAYDSNGHIVWSSPVPNPEGAEFVETQWPVLSPDGVLYGIGADSHLRALRASSGALMWRVPIDQRVGYAQLSGGGGDAVFIHPFTQGEVVIARDSGASLGELLTAAGQRVAGFPGIWELGWDFGIGIGSLVCFDTCGSQKWSTWVDSSWNEDSGIIAAGEHLVAVKWKANSNGDRLTPDSMSLYDVYGNVVGGPVEGAGKPFVAGADGAIYTVNCEQSSSKANQVVAYSADLTEMWRIDIGLVDNCPVGNGVLDRDGVLYLTHAMGTGQGVEVVAVQTQSPGLAESSWPSLRHDNRGSSWLVSLPSAPFAGQEGEGADAMGTGAADVPLE